MKKVLFTMLALVLVLTLGLVTAAPVAASPGIVSIWHFDEGSGSTTSDAVGANHGTLMGDTAWVSPGKFGNALSFDGSGDYVSVNDSISLSSIENGGTWELWIKPNSDLRQSKWIGFLDTAPGLVGAIQALVDPSNRLRACFGGVVGAAWSIDSDWTGEWHHIVGTWDQQVNPTVTLYVDGVQKAQATPTVTVKVDLLHIGSMNYCSFNGIIDEVRIWDEALSADDIAYNYSLRDVPIDIKPGSEPNSINLDSKGVVPVAILGSASFDAATVDPSTVNLAGATVRFKGKSGNAGSLEDINSDGYLDLVVQVYTNQLYVPGDGEVFLTAYIYDGPAISGSDWVRIVPP